LGATPDVIVVGAGIAGAATARYLAAAGVRTLVLEAATPGFGASGRNPGFLWLQTKSHGEQMALALAGRGFADRLCEELEDFGFRACGGLIVIRDEALLPVSESFIADRRRAGLAETRLLRGADLKELVPDIGDQVVAAVWNPSDAHQDTSRLIRVLLADAGRCGATVRTGCRARALIVDRGRVLGIETDGGERIEAAWTVLAAGYGAAELLTALGIALPFVPMRLEAAQTGPAPFRLKPVISGQALFRHFAFVRALPGYVEAMHPAEALAPQLGFTEQAAQYPDGRIRFGCAFSLGSARERATVAGQALAYTVMTENLPALGAVPIEGMWAGTVCQTPDSLPIVDIEAGFPGLALNLGHVFGNLAGPICGAAIAALIAGEASPIDTKHLTLTRLARAARPSTERPW
jgi:glycine/D-amino acid oxidase-like deaminating enzyme